MQVYGVESTTMHHYPRNGLSCFIPAQNANTKNNHGTMAAGLDFDHEADSIVTTVSYRYLGYLEHPWGIVSTYNRRIR